MAHHPFQGKHVNALGCGGVDAVHQGLVQRRALLQKFSAAAAVLATKWKAIRPAIRELKYREAK